MKRRSVLKFGGTSVRDAQAIQQVCKIIKENDKTKVVVVSAVAGVTNKLVEFCNSPKGSGYNDAKGANRLRILSDIQTLHKAIIEELKLRDEVLAKITNKVDMLRAFVEEELSLADVDEIVAYGELFSSFIIYHYLLSQGLDVAILDAREVIITNSNFGKAVPLIREIKSRSQQKIISKADDKIYITQGFIGATIDGTTTTLGRGGSDFSAALFAEGIDSEELFIYTDVKGVYTTDPRLIKEAMLIEKLTFQEMTELANFGAKVLHPSTISPCQRAEIPVIIASTFAPYDGGTIIRAATNRGNELIDAEVKAVCIRKNEALFTIRSINMINAYGFLEEVFRIFAEYKIPIDIVSTSEASIALTIDLDNVGSHGISPLKNNEFILKLKKIAELTIEEGFTLVTLVGDGLDSSGIVQRVLACVDEYPIRLISYGANARSNLSLLVKSNDSLVVLKTIHKSLIEVKNA